MKRNLYPVSALLTGLYLIACTLVPTAVHAQKASASSAAQVSAISISGTTLDKKSFSLQSLKGKVVMVMFWSTDCAVCRDKMPELRRNAAGWADKPFELVLVSVDRSMNDVESYNAIVNKSVSVKQRFTQLWTGESTYKDNLDTAQLSRAQLPTTLLIDKSGKLVERYSGRIPAEVWDTISDLL